MSVKNEDGQYPYLMIGEDHAGMSNTTIQTLLKGGM